MQSGKMQLLGKAKSDYTSGCSSSFVCCRTASSEAEQTPGEAWTRMRQACAYIEAHYTENLHQADVAHATGLSPWYFSRMFRQYVSSSFPEYLARVHAARRLLANNSLTITECAYQAGFQSTTAFNKAFAEWTGCTPREYRRTFLQAIKTDRP